MNLLVPLLALAAPFVLWPIELLLPYPYVIEELVKAGLVWLNPKFRPAVAIGLAFAFSETVLYIFNLNPYRLLLTILLHTTTTLIIYGFTTIDKKLIVVGTLLAMGLHFGYNAWIPSQLSRLPI